MYDIRDFSIISTENDSMLFFSSSYQQAVTQAINNIMKEFEKKNPGVDFNSVHLNLMCNVRTIEIMDNSAKIHLIGNLSEYDKTEDLSTFTF